MLLHYKDGIKGKLIDLDTGKIIPKVIWADLDSGLLCAYQVDESTGKVKRNVRGDLLTYTAHARMKWEPAESKPEHVKVDRCHVTGKPAGQLKDNICPCSACRKYNNLPVGKIKRSKRIPRWLLTDHHCEHYGCGKRADWLVSDEVVMPPEKTAQGFFSRAKTVAVRYWCSKHFQAPRVLDTKLEIVKVDEEVKARPI